MISVSFYQNLPRKLRQKVNFVLNNFISFNGQRKLLMILFCTFYNNFGDH